MNPERRRQLSALYHAAAARRPTERAAFLAEACGVDEALRHDVESLLDWPERAEPTLSESALGVFRPDPDEPAVGPLPRQRFGVYEILERIGAGGMGEVYRARDTQLGRDVAIKILRHTFTGDSSHRARVEREARLLAALNHPNIAIIHGLENADGNPALVMELIEGETLAERIARGPIPLDDTLRIAGHIAEALEVAHRYGIMHRDLKPANIKMSAGGMWKVLDFGLAKIVDDGGRSSERTGVPTIAELSAEGVLLGTPAYMSPEQVRGLPLDTRTDIWSFGCVLYEMLTAHRAFYAETILDTAVAVLDREPDWNAVPPVPDQLVRLLQSCLDKASDHRPDDIGSIRLLLDKCRQTEPQGSMRRWWIGAALAALILAIVVPVALRPSVDGSGGRDAIPVRPAVDPARRSVAVIGFRNVAGRAESAWLSAALAEMLATEIAAGDVLRVIPGETILRVKTELALPEAESFAPETLARIRNNLDSDLVVSGAYVLVGANTTGELRLDLRLQDAVTGQTVLRLAETGSVSDLFNLVSRVGRQLRTSLSVPEPVETQREGWLQFSMPSNPEAARLYTEGLTNLWRFEALNARDLLTKAVQLQPMHALAHSALAAALADIGEDARATEEAKRALELSEALPRRERLWIEGRFYETARDWNRASEVYGALLGFYPDNVEYALELGDVLISGGRAKEALVIASRFRASSPNYSENARIDLLEARAFEALSDFRQELSSAQRAIDGAIAAGASLIVARSRIAEAWALMNLGEAPKALAANAEAMRLYSTAGDNRGVARALSQTGAVLREQGQLAEATDVLQRAVKILRTLGNKRNLAVALNGLANIAFEQMRLGDAERLYTEVLTISREIGDKIIVAQALSNLASVSYEQDDLRRSASLDAESLALRREIGDKRGVAASLLNMAESAVARGDVASASEMYVESLALYRELGNKTRQALALSGLGAVRLMESKFAEARRAHEEALALRMEMNDRDAAAENQLALAEVALEASDPTDAHRLAALAAAEFERSARSDLLARSYTIMARAFLRQGQRESARIAVNRAIEMNAKSGNPTTRLLVQIEATGVQLSLEPRAGASRAPDDLLKQAVKAQVFPLQLEARLLVQQLEAQRGNILRANAGLKMVEEEASVRGLRLIAQRARTLSRE